MNIIKVGLGQVGITHKSGTRVIRDTIFQCANSKTSTSIVQLGGTLIFENVWITGGVGPQIYCGDRFEWNKGGSTGITRKYGVGYFGNIHPGTNTRIKVVSLFGLRFTHHSTDEALLRAMGVDDMTIDDCEFDGSGHDGKQVCQFRHVKKLTVIDSDFKNSLVFGTLDAKGCKSEEERKAYHADANKYRISASFDAKSKIWGYTMVTGQTDLVINGTQLMGKDIRDGEVIGGDRAFMPSTISGIKPPTLKVINPVNTGKWPRIQ